METEKSQTLKLDGEAYKGKFELNNWKSIEKYLKENVKNLDLRNKDTGEQIKLSTRGIDKLLSRSIKNGEEYAKTLAHLPKIIESMIYISSEDNKKAVKKGYDKYRHYLTEIEMDGKTYTVESIVGENQGKFYYDQQMFISKERLANVDQRNSQARHMAGTESEPTL